MRALNAGRSLYRYESKSVCSWHYWDIVLCGFEFRLWRLSGRVAAATRGPGLTHKRHPAYRYSITSSARASSEGGTANPSALVVLRLMNSSTFVG
jgi:hypothetical protein